MRRPYRAFPYFQQLFYQRYGSVFCFYDIQILILHKFQIYYPGFITDGRSSMDEGSPDKLDISGQLQMNPIPFDHNFFVRIIQSVFKDPAVFQDDLFRSIIVLIADAENPVKVKLLCRRQSLL